MLMCAECVCVWVCVCYIKCICMYIMCVIIFGVYVYMMCMHEIECIHVYVCMCVCYIIMCMTPWVIACCSDLDSFVRSELGNRRSRLRVRCDPMHWRFEDRSMGWSGDPYRFVQWRPDGDSDTKSRHFMWVFVLMLFLYLLLPVGVYVTIRIISCDHVMYFTSMITCITSWDISERSPYLFSCYECLLASFHVLVVRRYWLRASCGIS